MAIPNATKAGISPSQCHESFTGIHCKYEDKLRMKSGTKIRNPADAAKPIPRQILINVSMDIIFQIYSKFSSL